MTRGDNYDHGMERSAAKGERERERGEGVPLTRRTRGFADEME